MMRRRLMNWLILLVVAYGALLLLLRWREPHFIYYPFRELDATPANAGLAFEEVWLTTADGVRIHGWWIPAPSSLGGGRPPPSQLSPGATSDERSPGPATLQRSTRSPRPAVLFLHGNAGNISHRLEKLSLFHELGADTLIIDYRGYGRSDGTPSEAGTYRDADAAYDHLLKARNREPRQVIVYGESLGAAVAVDLAVRQPVGGVVIEEPFTSTAEVGQRMFPFVPARWLVRNKYDTIGKLPRLTARLLIFHSRGDEMFPFAWSARLLAAAAGPKRLVELRGSHNDAFAVSAAVYRAALDDFLR